MGWRPQGDGKWFYGLNVENGHAAAVLAWIGYSAGLGHLVKAAVAQVAKEKVGTVLVVAEQIGQRSAEQGRADQAATPRDPVDSGLGRKIANAAFEIGLEER